MSESSETRLNGMVKWFNSKAGYGFITVCGEERDIFVHYSNIKVSDMPYTYLTQGEYVQFELAETNNEQHKFQAIHVTGIAGGPILCETRRNNRQATGLKDDGSEENREMYSDRRVFSKGLRRHPPSAPRSSDAKKAFDEQETSGFTTIKKRNVRKSTD